MTGRAVAHVHLDDVLTGPLFSRTDTRAQWLLRRPDGHVWAQVDGSGQVVSAQVLGAYGMPLGTARADVLPDPLVGRSDLRAFYGLHGVETDDAGAGFRMGVRNVLETGDGTWLQPEPLLHLGPGAGQLAMPRAMVGPYALGAPTGWSDRSGYEPVSDFFKNDPSGQVISSIKPAADRIRPEELKEPVAAVVTTTVVMVSTEPTLWDIAWELINKTWGNAKPQSSQAPNAPSDPVSSSTSRNPIPQATHGPSPLGDAREGDTVYRVFGGDATETGRSWTRTDPWTTACYRDAAGLPDANSGRYLLEGRLKTTDGVSTRAALELDGRAGGLDEVYIPDPSIMVERTGMSTLMVPF